MVEAVIVRIEERDPSLNAFVHRGFHEARIRAADIDSKLAHGIDVGPLAGVPTAQKDLFNFYPGWPSTFGGLEPLRNFALDLKTTYPQRMEDAGAVMLGVTNSPVMGFRGTCDNPLFGPTRNPFDLSRNSGGSSGGAAAAVADGLIPIAGGTDGGGSIRMPAAWCGVFGFQPSFGRVPLVMRPNAFGGVLPFCYEGPIARTVGDAALAMAALAGHNPADPYSVADDVDWLGATTRPVETLTIGFAPNLGGFPVDPAVANAIAAAMKGLEDAGMKVVPLDLALPCPHGELTDLWCRTMAAMLASAFDSFKAQGLDILGAYPEAVPAELRRWLDVARGLSRREIEADLALRTQAFDMLQGALGRVDLIACPTMGCLAVANGADGNTLGPREIAGEPVDPLIGYALTYLTNFCGNPAASLPAGLVAGLPVGLQLIGRRWADADLLAACAAFEAARPWVDTYGICASRPLS
jgi:amidase/aspartyl-tRNA(Asn)/glutamyl-tRNA(Gln) amidotransferase subunit A